MISAVNKAPPRTLFHSIIEITELRIKQIMKLIEMIYLLLLITKQNKKVYTIYYVDTNKFTH